MNMNKLSMYKLVAVVAMIATPLAAAILFGWHLYLFLVAQGVSEPLAIVGGISGAVAVESVGIFAGHTLVELIKLRDWRLIVPLVAMLFYIYVGWSTVPQYGIIFVLAAFVYLMVGLLYDLEKKETTVSQQIAFDREQEAADREVERQERLARAQSQQETDRLVALAKVESAAKVKIANAKAKQSKLVPAQNSIEQISASIEPAQSEHECEDCGRTFSTVQALNAHGRFCKGISEKISSNGSANGYHK